MKVNPNQETAASLLSSAISRDKLSTDFQASLDLAKQNQQKPRSKAPDTAALNDAMTAARKVLEDYIAKGPIAHLREQILKDLGLTEDDVAKMAPEQRDALEKTVAARMKEVLLAGTGVDTKGIQAQLMALSMAVNPAQKTRQADTAS